MSAVTGTRTARAILATTSSISPREMRCASGYPRDAATPALVVNGWVTCLFHEPRARHVPRIREHQDVRPMMQLPEPLCLFGLHMNIHRKTSAENTESLLRRHSVCIFCR